MVETELEGLDVSDIPTAHSGDVLPIIRHQENLFFGSDNDIPVMCHDIGYERNDR